MKKCNNPTCNESTTNPKYCSKSCSAKHTNVLYPKKKTKKKCVDCGEPVKSYRHNRCSIHHEEYKSNKYQNKTIGEYRNKMSVKGKHPSWVHSHIRNFCRNWNKDLTEQPCAFCNYHLHVELCHIKPLSDFPDDTLLGEVNSKQNVIQLCRNCHWELDHGYLSVSINKEGFPEFEDIHLKDFSIKAPDFDSLLSQHLKSGALSN